MDTPLEPESGVAVPGQRGVAAGRDINAPVTTGDNSPIYAPRLEASGLLPARQVPVLSREPVRRSEAPRSWQFVGRMRELERLRELLTGEGVPVVVRQVVHGMGGDHSADDQEVGAEEEGWEEALGVLASYSMITRAGVDEAETISMHRLFHSVIRNSLDYDDPRQHAARQSALAWLAQALPPDPSSNVDGWPVWRDLMPHLDALASCHQQRSEPPDLGEVLNYATLFALAQGQPQRAHHLAGRALAIAEAAYGPDHPGVAIRLGNLAGSFRALGRQGKAVPLEQRALAIAEAVYGPDHPTVATLLGNLATSFCDLGRPGEAVPLFERALAITEAAYGPDHPDVATLLRYLSYTMNAPCQCGSGRKLKRCHGTTPALAPESGQDRPDR